MKKLQIILDTDIGDDIDDVWALNLLLADPLFDVKLISVCYSDTDYKLQIVRDILERSNNGHIPLAAGTEKYNGGRTPHSYRFVSASPVKAPPSVEAIAKTVSGGAATDIVAIGPLTNVAEFVTAYPELKDKCRIIIMGGSVYRGYINQTAPCVEFNLECDAAAAVKVFTSDFKLIVAPLDVCRDFIIDGEYYQRIKNSDGAHAKIVIDYYTEWWIKYVGGAIKYDVNISGGILYDLLPVLYLSNPDEFLTEELPIVCDESGFLTVNSKGKRITALLKLKNKTKMYELVADRLCKGEN
ncbi:MAG: nucleoside hydrolase [Clostridiales bacterium]|jgi:inosine-uridine nucleoside N-ribohydrolase|nr:nucleoside hydrolase [Clostridiales bacterium]